MRARRVYLIPSVLASLGVLAFAACTLNPQPLPPVEATPSFGDSGSTFGGGEDGGAQQAKETSTDAATWAPAWTGDSALVTMSAALEDPLNIPIPFSFETRPARYLRFTQLGTEKTYYWSVAELRIVGQ